MIYRGLYSYPQWLPFITLSPNNVFLLLQHVEFGLDFFSADELKTDLTEQKEPTEQTEQTEIGKLNDVDIANFFTENRNKNTTKKTQ